MNRSSVREMEKTIPPGALISFLQKGLQYVGVEETLQRDGTDSGRKGKNSGKGRDRHHQQDEGGNHHSTNGDHTHEQLADFTLLAPRTMSGLYRQDPPIRINVPPAAAAAALKAKMAAEAKSGSKSSKTGDRRSSGNSATGKGGESATSQKLAAVSSSSGSDKQPELSRRQQQKQQKQQRKQEQQKRKQEQQKQQQSASSSGPSSSGTDKQKQNQGQHQTETGTSGKNSEKQTGSRKRAAPPVEESNASHRRKTKQDGGHHGRAESGAKAAAALQADPAGGASLGTKGGVASNSGGEVPSNGAEGPASEPRPGTTALHLQPGGLTSAFSPLESAVARLEGNDHSRREGKGQPQQQQQQQQLSLQQQQELLLLRQMGTENSLKNNVGNSVGGPATGQPYVNGINKSLDNTGQPIVNPVGPDRDGNPSTSGPVNVATGTQSQAQQPGTGSNETAPQAAAGTDGDQIDREDELTKAEPREVLNLSEHSSEVFMCAWNPVFTNLIATGSGDASARIWQMGGRNASSGCVGVWELLHGTDPRDKKNKDVTTLEWSGDGTMLATGSYDGIARVWSRTGTLVHTLNKHRGPIFSLKWNRSGNYLLSGSYDQSTIVWSVTGGTGQVVQQFTDHKAPALDVDWKDDTTFASCSTDQRVLICRVGVDAPLRVYKGHDDEVNAVKWDPSGTLLASCSDDCTAKVWDVSSGRTEPLHDLKSHRMEIYTVKW